MYFWIRSVVLALVLLVSVPVLAEDTKPIADPARIAAARDLMEVTGVTKQLEGMMDAMKQGFAKGAKAESSDAGKKASEGFDAAVAKLMSYKDDMITDFAALYAENFTAEEMKSVADFYRSGTGAKFIAMTPALMQKGSVIGMKYSQKVMEDLKASGAAPK
jgi:uncharacterized protein